MEKLLELLDEAKKELNQTKELKQLQKLKEEIQADEELMKKISLYNESKDERLRQEIYSNELYKKYKAAETELNILILSINSKLKEISNKGKCNI